MKSSAEIHPYLPEIVAQAGYQTIRSLMFLHNLAKAMQPECILELGTGYACSTAFMALALERGKIVSVDDRRDEAATIDIPLGNLERCGMSGKVILIDGCTFDAGRLFSEQVGDMPPELIFMDASHNDGDMQKEYAAIKGILLDSHLLVIDDIFAADEDVFISRLFKEQGYAFCLGLRHHNGMAILGTDAKYLQLVVDCTRDIP